MAMAGRGRARLEAPELQALAGRAKSEMDAAFARRGATDLRSQKHSVLVLY